MMKKYALSICLLFLIVVMATFQHTQIPKKEANAWPHLPAPLGNGKILITSAGQAIDGYILESMTKELHIEADYRPRVLATDVYEYNTVLFVVGYSPTGLLFTDRTWMEEEQRIRLLLQEIAVKKMPVIVVHMSGFNRTESSTNYLIDLIAPHTDYFIGLRSSDRLQRYRRLAQRYNFPITFVEKIEHIKTPLNSVFR
ncbi:hypothetical protein EJF36_20250 [Bacillus sp. HMF5848]|uniref:DUF6305 family protein n=1 Tax=Bacillus sp. HMF5848 TaxID=2495421 RepID=UPI000F78EF59|nr:DUF6305 family protein [Bacillus sp. HMF5848]RSK29026.1 hypothetical protein EJF36_20250 [Bacillus sp. HMF5848]